MKLFVLCALLVHLVSSFTFTCSSAANARNCYNFWAQHNSNSNCFVNIGSIGCGTTVPNNCPTAFRNGGDYDACGLTRPWECRTSAFNFNAATNFQGDERTFDFFSEALQCSSNCGSGRVPWTSSTDWTISGKCKVGRGSSTSNDGRGTLVRNWGWNPQADSTITLSGSNKANDALIFTRGGTAQSSGFQGVFWTINPTSLTTSGNFNIKTTFTIENLTFRGGVEGGTPNNLDFAATLFSFSKQTAVTVRNVDFINLDYADAQNPTTLIATQEASLPLQKPKVTFDTVMVNNANSYDTVRVRTLFSSSASDWDITGLTVQNQIFHHESLVGNGVIYSHTDSKFDMKDSFVRNNIIQINGNTHDRDGGNNAKGGLFFFEKRFNATVSNVEFINNDARIPSTGGVWPTTPYQGGIIAAVDKFFTTVDYRSSLTITGSKFEENLHLGDGSALALWGNDLYVSVSSTTFKNNIAQRRSFNSDITNMVNAKGTIYISEILHGKFTGNTYEGNAADHGVVFYIADQSLIEFRQTTAVEFKNNKVTKYSAADTSPTNHFNRGRGGAGAMAIMDSQVSMWNPRFISNMAEYGGALDIVNSHVFISGAIFDGNQATFFTNYSDFEHGAGGAIRMTDSRVQISESTFKDNLAHNGGAIFARQTGQQLTGAAQNPSLNLFKVTFTYDEAVDVATQTSGAVFEGGSIYAESIDLEADECEFTKSKAKKGGAVRVVDVVDRLSNHNHILRFRKCTFTDNRARSTAAPGNPIPSIEPDFAGGAISSTRALEVIECNFVRNQAHQGNGGAIDAERGLTVDASQFNQNSAPTFFGGAIYTKPMYQENVVIRDSDFLQNSAGSGGAIFTRNPLTRIDRCSFRANNAQMSNTNGLGGAINFWSRGIVTGSSFRENTAASDGAAIYTTAQVTVDHSTFTVNGDSTTRGGAIKCVTNPSPTSSIELALTVINSAFTVNSGLTGSAIWTSCDTKVFGSTFDSNSVASQGNSVGDIYCSNSARALSGCHLDVANSTFTAVQPYASTYIEQPTNSNFDNGHLWLRGSTFNGAAVWVNGNVDIYEASAAAGRTTSFNNGASLKVWGDAHIAKISGVSTSSGVITIDNIELAVLGSLKSDSSSQLVISNTRVTTMGATELGGLSLGPIGGPEMTLGGNVVVRGSGAWTGRIGGPYNITFMSGSAGQWQGGDLGVGGNIIINSGASLSIAQHSSALQRPIWNWGLLTFTDGSGSGISFQSNIMNMAGAHLTCGPSADGTTNIGSSTGGTIFNWGNMEINGLCSVAPNTFLYQSSHLWFDITSDVAYDTVSFSNYVQFAGALTARDHRDFNPGPNGSWDWKRDFGTKYNLIRLRSSYRQSTYNQFRARDVAYIRNYDRQGVPGFRVRFPVPGKIDQPPYLLYGFGTNRSYIFLSNPASFLSFSPVVLFCSLVFALW